jgi:hypothetical protein
MLAVLLHSVDNLLVAEVQAVIAQTAFPAAVAAAVERLTAVAQIEEEVRVLLMDFREERHLVLDRIPIHSVAVAVVLATAEDKALLVVLLNHSLILIYFLAVADKERMQAQIPMINQAELMVWVMLLTAAEVWAILPIQ